MNLIYFLLRSSWRMVVIAIFTGCVSGVSSTSLIALISRVVGQGSTQTAAVLGWSFAGLAIIALITNIISQTMLIRLAQTAIFQLRLSLTRQIFSSELAHLEKLGASRLLATLTDDVQMVAEAVRLVPFICTDLAIVVGCLLYITWLSWTMALVILALIGIALTVHDWLMRRARYQLALAREEQDSLFKQFRAVTDGTKELKLHYHRRQAFLENELQPVAAAYRRYNINGLTLFAIIENWGKFLFFATIGLVVFVLPHFLAFNPQIFSGYVLTLIYLTLPMESLISRLPVLSRAGVALSKIESLGLSLKSRSETLSPPAAIYRDWKELQLKAITHTYRIEQDTDFVLGPIDLALHPGELVFIVGGNGSGKSTLAKLITGLYLPETGEIRLDGQRIDEQNCEWYRQHFTVVFADFYLFDRLLGLEEIDSETPQRYLEQLNLNHKIRIEQGKLSTTQLSQGQRKRLALLTAYLENRPIYLFDEWAADQDPTFKHLFYTQLLPDLRNQGKTILVISHDDHYFHLADRLIKLDYGKVEYEQRYR